MALSDALQSPEKAKEAAVTHGAARDEERTRIRAKFSEADRNFIDDLLRTFSGSRLVAIRFSDGEEIGAEF